MKPGILVITWNFPPRRGGIENLISSLCAGLEKNHSVWVVTSHDRSEPGTAGRIFRPRWSGLFTFFLYALARGAIVLYRYPAITVVLGGSALTTPVVLLLARAFRRKAIIQTHGLDLIYPGKLYQLLCVRWIKFCDRIIANSHYTAHAAREKSVRASAVTVIPPGISRNGLEPFTTAERVRAALRLEGRKAIVFVGRLVRRKGVKEFIENSMPAIAAAVPTACLVVVGENPVESLVHKGDVSGELKTVVEALHLHDHARILGWVNDDELRNVFKIADLIILPALPMTDDVEGFGMVLLEGAAAGVPAVATRVGGIPDAIEDGKSGVLVEPGDYTQLTETIIALLVDDQRRRAMGEYARQRAEQSFSWERIIERYDSALMGAY